MFGGNFACGGGPVAGSTVGPVGGGGTFTAGTGTSGHGFGTTTGGVAGGTAGTTGTSGAVQYCQESDAGIVPCDELDGGTGSQDGG